MSLSALRTKLIIDKTQRANLLVHLRYHHHNLWLMLLLV